jgi:hypothetical protein
LGRDGEVLTELLCLATGVDVAPHYGLRRTLLVDWKNTPQFVVFQSEDFMAEVEIGIFKSARQAYGFDDIAIVPSRRTVTPKTSISVAD